MFRRIIVPLDVENNFQSSKVVLDKAYCLAEKFYSEIHLIHIIPSFVNELLGEYFPQTWFKKRIRKVEDKLKNIVKEYLNTRVKFSTYVGKGSVYDEIVNYSQKAQGDLIMLFTIDTSSKSYMLGCNAREILKNSEVSVIVVRD